MCCSVAAYVRWAGCTNSRNPYTAATSRTRTTGEPIPKDVIPAGTKNKNSVYHFSINVDELLKGWVQHGISHLISYD